MFILGGCFSRAPRGCRSLCRPASKLPASGIRAWVFLGNRPPLPSGHAVFRDPTPWHMSSIIRRICAGPTLGGDWGRLMKNGLQRWRQSVGRGNQEETSPCGSRPEATQLRPSRLSLTPAHRGLSAGGRGPGLLRLVHWGRCHLSWCLVGI